MALIAIIVPDHLYQKAGEIKPSQPRDVILEAIEIGMKELIERRKNDPYQE